MAKKTIEQLKEELATYEDTVEFEYPEKETVKSLSALLVEVKATASDGDGGESETDAESDSEDKTEDPDNAQDPEVTPEETASPEPQGKTETNHVEPTMATVTRPNGMARFYSYRTHGQHWRTLAKQHAEHVGGKLFES